VKDKYYEIQDISTAKALEKFAETHEKELTSYEWFLITKNSAFNLKIAEKYSESVDWDWISVMMEMNVAFIEKFIGLVDLYSISKFQPITFKFINDNKDILSMEKVIENPHVMKLDQYNKVKELYEQMRLDKKYVDVWIENMKKTRMLHPSEKILVNRVQEFYGHIERVKQQEEEAVRLKELGITKEEDIIAFQVKEKEIKAKIVEEKPKVKRTRKPKEEKIVIPDFNKMSKAELQEYVKTKGIRVYYHDTIAILKEKAIQKI
jgi:hypothetical protein